MNLKTLILSGILFPVTLISAAQPNAPTVKFGDVTPADFSPQIYLKDSSAEAVVLYDGGTAKYEGNSDTWFNILYTYHKRIRILNKNAFGAATVEIHLYNDNGKADELDKMEAATYTLEDGKVIKTKLDKSSVFKDKASADEIIKKFTFPNLKEGCIIEYTYTINSPRAGHLRGWVFQGQYPVLQSTYETNVPTLFNFVFLNSGYYDLQPSVSKSTENFRLQGKDNSSAFSSAEVINYNADVIRSKWTLTNLPPLVKEKYTTTIWNYLSKIEFQLRSINLPNALPKPVMQTWTQLVTEMLKDENFGEALSGKNSWMENDLAPITLKNDTLQTAQKIFSFVQQNFTCTDYYAIYMPGTLKSAYTARKGNVAELNLVLTAMLRKAGITADPVLLSTRDNGFAYEEYPLINKFNYVITRALIDGKEYLLDASRKKIGFNHLPDYCYNGSGRIINPEPVLLPLSADSLKEVKNTTVFISNSADGKKLEGTFNSDLGYYESYDLRNDMSAAGKDDFFKKIKTSYTYDINMENEGIDSLNNYNEPVSVHYDFSISPNEGIIYFNPLLTEARRSNPFTAATRNYPVEMPYAGTETITVSMEIPKGYKVDDLPKSERVKLNDHDGMFEYLVQADATMIQMRCRLSINKANFNTEDYDTLREFYAHIVKKEAEQIVFKKL